MMNYNAVILFMERNHKRLSKYYEEDRRLFTWVKHNRKVMNAGKMKPERLDLFKKLLERGEMFCHVNQYI